MNQSEGTGGGGSGASNGTAVDSGTSENRVTTSPPSPLGI